MLTISAYIALILAHLRQAVAAFAARLQLHSLAYHLANFLHTLALPDEVKQWSLTTLRVRLVHRELDPPPLIVKVQGLGPCWGLGRSPILSNLSSKHPCSGDNS